MRRFTAFVLVLCMMAAGLSACGGKESAQNAAGEDTKTETTQPETQSVGGYGFDIPKGYRLVTGQSDPEWSYALYQKGDTELIAESRNERYPKRALKDDYESRKAMNAEEGAGGKTERLKEEGSQGFRYDHQTEGAVTECGMEFLPDESRIITLCMTKAAESEAKTLTEEDLKEFDQLAETLREETRQTNLGDSCSIGGVTFIPPHGFQTERVAEGMVVYTNAEKPKASMTIKEAGPAEPLPGKEELTALAGDGYSGQVKEVYKATACGEPAICAALEKNGVQNGVLICFNAEGTRFEAYVSQKELTKKTLKACLASLEQAQKTE